jgi:replicative superfamily II helicase
LVDFSKLLEKKSLGKEIDPVAIFERLDKETSKEYLRPPQTEVLSEWHQKFRSRKDSIIKLHTGQGKTLIGLLMLQSYLNEGKGPAIESNS